MSTCTNQYILIQNQKQLIHSVMQYILSMFLHNARYVLVRTRFGLNPKREWIQVHGAQTMNLQSAGKKASLILGQNIGFQCKKIQDTNMKHSNKSLRTCPRDVIFLFFSSRFFRPPLFCLSSLYIPWLFAFFIIHVWIWHSTSFFVILLALS